VEVLLILLAPVKVVERVVVVQRQQERTVTLPRVAWVVDQD